MPVNFGLLNQTPNFNALLMDGYNAGREMKRQEGERNALAALVAQQGGTGGTGGGVLGGMGAGGYNTPGIGDEVRGQQGGDALADLARYNPQMAMGIQQQDQQRQMQLNQQQQKMLEQGQKAVGQAALIVAQQPPEQRAQAWDGVIDQLVQQGWDGLARYKGQYSEQALQAVIAQAGLANELRQTVQPSYQVVPEGGVLVNTRDPSAVQQFGQPQAAPPAQPGANIPQGSPLSPAPARAPAVARPQGASDSDLIAQARAAIEAGADANEVFRRLRDWGVRP